MSDLNPSTGELGDPERPLPNLFVEARGELAQDAFLSWLARWADPGLRGVNPKLHAVGERFVRRVLGPCARGEVIAAVDARCQVGGADIRLDVSVDVRFASGRRHLVVVEHKFESKFDDLQMQQYAASAANILKVNAESVSLVFLKTGILGLGDRRSSDRWSLIDRAELLQILGEEWQSAGSDILRDYVAWITAYEIAATSWQRGSPSSFGDPHSVAWQGFIEAVVAGLDRVPGMAPGGGIVNAPTGAFGALWWGWREINGHTVYLQAHANEGHVGVRRAVRVAKQGHPAKSKVPLDVRRALSQDICDSGAPTGWRKPARIGGGVSSAVAELAGPWWIEVAGTADLARTVEALAANAEWFRALEFPRFRTVSQAISSSDSAEGNGT